LRNPRLLWISRHSDNPRHKQKLDKRKTKRLLKKASYFCEEECHVLNRVQPSCDVFYGEGEDRWIEVSDVISDVLERDEARDFMFAGTERSTRDRADPRKFVADAAAVCLAKLVAVEGPAMGLVFELRAVVQLMQGVFNDGDGQIQKGKELQKPIRFPEQSRRLFNQLLSQANHSLKQR
jgi:hypothetical protein